MSNYMSERDYLNTKKVTVLEESENPCKDDKHKWSGVSRKETPVNGFSELEHIVAIRKCSKCGLVSEFDYYANIYYLL